jgi:hypothetical protein
VCPYDGELTTDLFRRPNFQTAAEGGLAVLQGTHTVHEALNSLSGVHECTAIGCRPEANSLRLSTRTAAISWVPTVVCKSLALPNY